MNTNNNNVNTKSIYNLVTLREICNHHDGEITISPQAIEPTDVAEKVKQWHSNQGRFWPENITPLELLSDLMLVFAPHWVLSGTAFGTWSAQIGMDYKEQIRCTKCAGSGRVINYFDGGTKVCMKCWGKGFADRTQTNWRRESGDVGVSVSEIFRENMAITSLKCGKRDYSAKEFRLNSSSYSQNSDSIFVFIPNNLGDSAGEAIIEKILKDKVAREARDEVNSAGDRSKNFSFRYSTNSDVRLWLYPIYVSHYKFKNKIYVIKIDGITGIMNIPVPDEINFKRFTFWAGGSFLAITMPLISLIIAVIFVFLTSVQTFRLFNELIKVIESHQTTKK